VNRDEALGNYVKLGWRREEVAGELREIHSELSTLRAIIFAEQVKPQREPKKGGYQPRGRSKEIVGQVLASVSCALTAKQIRENTTLSVDQVTEALKQLRKEGYVNRDGTQGRHVYQLAIRKENENQDNSNNSIGKLSDVPSFQQLRAGTDDAFNR
jgi:hypothetical protein